MENIETLTEVFEFYYKCACEEFNEGLVTAKLSPQHEIKFKIEKASEFELGIYLLFHIDRDMCGKQKEDIRKALFDSCMYSILPSNEEQFTALVDHRMKIYGEIFNDAIKAGEDWGKVVERWHDWLINAMLYCENDYDRMTTEVMPLVIVGATEHWAIKLVLFSTEVSDIAILSCIFKHVFADNNDLTMLSHEELLKRIDAGSKEGHSIAKKSFE